MKTNSKILVMAVIAIIMMSAFSFVNAGAGYQADLWWMLAKDPHTICGKTYQATEEQSKIIEDYLMGPNSKEFTDAQCIAAINGIKGAIDLLNSTGATKLSDVPKDLQLKAISMVEEAAKNVGVTVKVDTNANTLTATEAETGKVLASTTYATDTTGNIDIGAKPSAGAVEVKKFYQDSSAPVVFRFLVDYSYFQNGGKVYVDDKVIDSSKYISKSGSTIIEIKPEYAKTLAVGRHTVTVEFTNGQRLSEGFEVLAGVNNGGNGGAVAASAGNPVATGKAFAYTGNDNIAYIALSLLAVAAVSTTFVKKVNEK